MVTPKATRKEGINTNFQLLKMYLCSNTLFLELIWIYKVLIYKRKLKLWLIFHLHSTIQLMILVLEFMMINTFKLLT